MKRQYEFYTVRGYKMMNAEKKLLTSSMEDYLEMIYRICKKEDYVRMSHLAKKLNVRPSSATKIVQKLRDLGIVDYQKYGIIQLTDKGERLGKFLLKRHNIIEEFLKNIGTEDTRLKDTEMIEHGVSFNTLKNIDLLNKFLLDNPNIIQQFEEFKRDYCE
ncbi:metal-dependent transcriptional regulator [Schnuerera sp.]|uniref:metal-dependent transcriptional regulator n=1 Tax=Schnuerera sp. TaxID=2794844 RepID=UPI002C758D37|nr:iron dependent repressor, metal binding and dimerization domain protein [Schnuerera sp.]HSH36768.1 iron dependent repressor, metal binding and dimerization domain protein [Schnuerera sp.]